MAVWLAFVFSFVYCVVSQAPGDGDSLCTDEFVNGMENPFYDNRPTYADNVRPLMDSRNYVVLLEREGDEGAHIPRWQQVDNDNNNTDETVTEVRNLRTTYTCTHVYFTARCVYFVSSGVNLEANYAVVQLQCVALMKVPRKTGSLHSTSVES